ncbi:MAG: hypothetical protein COB35_12460 [Gammaproteobacteria bacterium]|nr:MAG: hypothetical protein COB35_12460 [Gammaproteobacteria bacterium]
MEILLIKNMIKGNTHDNTINIKGIANKLGIEILITSHLSTDLAQVYVDENDKPVIQINENTDLETKYTLMVIAMADYILKPKKVSKTGIIYDMFFLDDIFSQRYHYRMLLATRLAFPEHVIEKLCNKVATIGENDINYMNFVQQSNYLSQFIRSCIDDSSALFLIKNTNDLPIQT